MYTVPRASGSTLNVYSQTRVRSSGAKLHSLLSFWGCAGIAVMSRILRAMIGGVLLAPVGCVVTSDNSGMSDLVVRARGVGIRGFLVTVGLPGRTWRAFVFHMTLGVGSDLRESCQRMSICSSIKFIWSRFHLSVPPLSSP